VVGSYLLQYKNDVKTVLKLLPDVKNKKLPSCSGAARCILPPPPSPQSGKKIEMNFDLAIFIFSAKGWIQTHNLWIMS
jgi:hypothetical protein